jgi:hypothetical protein
MSAPVKPLLGLVAAFAGGVAVTVAIVGRPDRTPEPAATPKPAEVASLETPSRSPNSLASAGSRPASDTDGWVDPVKRSPQASASPSSLPPLIFHLHDKTEPSGNSASQSGAQDGAGHKERSIVAQVSPPQRPSASELLAKAETEARPALVAKAVDRPSASKPSDDLAARKAQASRLTARPNHKSESARIASNYDDEADAGPVVERPDHRFYVPGRGYGHPAEQPYGRRYVELSDRYERDVVVQPRSYRKETTSAPPSGVMRWLVER